MIPTSGVSQARVLQTNGNCGFLHVSRESRKQRTKLRVLLETFIGDGSDEKGCAPHSCADPLLSLARQVFDVFVRLDAVPRR